MASAVGFAYDAGSGAGELTTVFSALYAMGCLTAVLAVRRAGVFTAVIQPPLILFVVVPGAYFLMHSGDIHGIKDVLINCGYPLIERFPLMFFTSAAVLLIGIGRWYFGASGATATTAPATDESGLGRLSATLASLIGGRRRPEPDAGNDDRRPSAPRRAAGAKRASGRPARSGRPTKRSAAPSRSRHARPPETETIDPVVDLDRPRRRRPRTTDPAPEPRRRQRSASTRDSRGATPPGERRGAHDRSERPDRERAQRADRPRPPRRPRYEGFDGYEGAGGYEPLEPHAYGPASHHPISRVRYRGSDDSDDRPRRRAPRDFGADRWEYDI